MRATTLHFAQLDRRVYTLVKRVVEKFGQFRHIVTNDETFVITVRYEPAGMGYSRFVIGF